MNEPVAIQDVMARTFVGVTEGDHIAEVAELLTSESTDYAVVLHGSTPVGIVRAIDIVDVIATNQDPRTMPVSEVMESSLTTISVDHALVDAISALEDDQTNRIIVTEDDAIVGVISESDILTAHRTLWFHEENSQPVIPVATTTTSDESNPESSAMQGVCEICGSLSQQLTDQNGQFVCAECLAI